MQNLGGIVLIVDDDWGDSELMATLLARTGYATHVVNGGEEALSVALATRPALVLLDIKLPDVSGYEVCRELKDAWGSELPIIFVSGVRTEPLDRAAGLLIGADDYIVKPFDPDEFLARVRRQLMRPSRPAQLNGPTTSLTPRELEVLRLLADGLDQAAIAERLFISPKTVATHIQRILEKLDVHSRAQAVAAAHRLGL